MSQRTQVAISRGFYMGRWAFVTGLFEALIGVPLFAQPAVTLLVAPLGGFTLFFVLAAALAYAFPPSEGQLAAGSARWLVWPLLAAGAIATVVYALSP